MADVIYLKKGEFAPRDQRTLMIEVVSDRSRESAQSGPAGFKIRVSRSRLADTLKLMIEKVDGNATHIIYVKELEK